MQIWEAMKWNGEKIAFGHHEKSRPRMYVWKSKAIKQKENAIYIPDHHTAE